ncbi:hypothetical protein [Bacillus bombysepticus]|uniref:hypothetical protein n=1 Tax=Bacillus bombysepticus TaxID=658666 RepID=UPI00301A51E9
MIRDFFNKYSFVIFVTLGVAFILACIIGTLMLTTRYDIIVGVVSFVLWFIFGTKSGKTTKNEHTHKTEEDEKHNTKED